MRALTFLVLLNALATPALAANTWRIDALGDGVVMGELSTLQLRVTNTGNETRLTSVSMTFNGSYELIGGEAPAGWYVYSLDMQARAIRFAAVDGCAHGLAPGASAVFGVRVVAASAAADGTNDVIVSSFGLGLCNTIKFFWSASPTARWTRNGLAGHLQVAPRSLPPGSELDVVLTVTNRSTAAQNAIAPPLPRVATAGQFLLREGPSPATLSLAAGASGTFTWTFRAETNGVFRFESSARSANARTPTVYSLNGVVGVFRALPELSPEKVSCGQSVVVSLSVSNNDTRPYMDVRPLPLTVTGTAQAVPEPGSAPTPVGYLPPGGTTGFQWTYRITGEVGQTFQFTGQAEATVDGEPISSDPVNTVQGTVILHGVTITPSALLDGTTDPVLRYTVYNGGTDSIRTVQVLTPDAAHFPVSPTHYLEVPTGWTASDTSTGFRWSAGTGREIPAGGQQTFALRYRRAGTGAMDEDMTFVHRVNVSPAGWWFPSRVDTPVTVFVARTVPDVSSLVAVSGTGQNRLTWTNPADHHGVLILRARGVVNGTPAVGVSYQAGDTLGNAEVVYADTASFVSSFTDAGLSNNSRYHYRVYNHDAYFNYSSGNVPSTKGLFSEPTTKARGTPLWCYSLGYSAMQQPVTDPGNAVFSANMLGTATANTTRVNDPDADGGEMWRPAKLDGAVQSRFLVVPLAGRTGKHLVVGDQAGKAYAIKLSNGSVAWRGLAGAALAEHIQAPPAMQSGAYSNAAFTAAHPGRDLLFFATRNDSATDNRVYALSSVDGSEVWRTSGAPMDMVNGGMAVDYDRNRLFVPSRSNGGAQPSLWVFDTTNGNLVTPPQPFLFGDVDHGVTLMYRNGAFVQALVTSNSGRVYGIDLASLTVAWSFDLPGAPSTFVTPANSGFIAVLANGTIQRYAVGTGNPPTVTPVWSNPPVIAGPPSGLTIDYVDQKIFVGGADGMLHQIRTDSGLDEKQVRVSTSPIGDPTLDRTARRVHLGTLDGRVCAFELPLP